MRSWRRKHSFVYFSLIKRKSNTQNKKKRFHQSLAVPELAWYCRLKLKQIANIFPCYLFALNIPKSKFIISIDSNRLENYCFVRCISWARILLLYSLLNLNLNFRSSSSKWNSKRRKTERGFYWSLHIFKYWGCYICTVGSARWQLVVLHNLFFPFCFFANNHWMLFVCWRENITEKNDEIEQQKWRYGKTCDFILL